eukprot:51640-Pelagomonas_calceolata.AAC.9
MRVCVGRPSTTRAPAGWGADGRAGWCRGAACSAGHQVSGSAICVGFCGVPMVMLDGAEELPAVPAIRWALVPATYAFVPAIAWAFVIAVGWAFAPAICASHLCHLSYVPAIWWEFVPAICASHGLGRSASHSCWPSSRNSCQPFGSATFAIHGIHVCEPSGVRLFPRAPFLDGNTG